MLERHPVVVSRRDWLDGTCLVNERPVDSSSSGRVHEGAPSLVMKKHGRRLRRGPAIPKVLDGEAYY